MNVTFVSAVIPFVPACTRTRTQKAQLGIWQDVGQRAFGHGGEFKKSAGVKELSVESAAQYSHLVAQNGHYTVSRDTSTAKKPSHQHLREAS